MVEILMCNGETKMMTAFSKRQGLQFLVPNAFQILLWYDERTGKNNGYLAVFYYFWR